MDMQVDQAGYYFSAASIQRLCTEVDSIQRSFGLSVSRRLWFCQDRYAQRPESDCVVCSTLPELLQAVATTGE